MASTSVPAMDFSCAICLDIATEPVVTRCGHLFCWECLDHWLHSAAGAPECPVCKGRVDERMSGDIIPLYGKGRQPATKAGSDQGTTSAPATTATSSTSANKSATSVADPAQRAFFSRPSAYSFAPARNARNAAQGSSQHHQEPEQQQHHPRPSADRAPPHPRPQQRHQFQNVHINRGSMPLTMGSGIFFFSGGTGVLFSILIVAIWTLYHYAPWREWAQVSARWFNRLRGHPEPANTSQAEHEAAADRPNQARTQPAATPSASAVPLTEDPNDNASPPPIVRHLIISLFLVFISIQLVAYM
ncbi:Zinc finger, C3HC4 type (RING finger)/Ring finger domain/RING-type zinc-finger/zinc finger of C3HC4-type, RING/Prokaryotic RING finger family 4, putative [Leishmania lindenbergi]|uniref:RING-type E3 ubiquitin transferase n=1 Tax=Leishmania lindenbergi TaxID=651832 RepID=A0AAW2ZTI1_9TRYP